MKNILSFCMMICVLCIQANPVSAQSRIQAGVQCGVNVCNVYGDDGVADDVKAGPAAGGFVSYVLYGRFSLRTEIMYTNSGYTYDIISSDTGPYRDLTVFSKNSVRLHRLKIPVLGFFEIAENVRVCAGPSMDIFLQGTEESVSQTKGIMRNESTGEWSIVDENGTSSGNIGNGSIRSPGFGVVFGAEYALKRFFAGIRYSMGLSELYIDNRLNMKDLAFQFFVGYCI